MKKKSYFPGFCWPSGLRVGWGIEINGRFEAERPPTSAGPPSDERAAFLTSCIALDLTV